MNVGEIRAMLEGRDDDSGVRLSMSVGDFRALIAGLPDDIPVLPSQGAPPRQADPPEVEEPTPVLGLSSDPIPLSEPDETEEEREWLEELADPADNTVELLDNADDGTGARCLQCGWCSGGPWNQWGGGAECPECASKMVIYLHDRWG